MVFLTPLFLIGLLAAAIPIAIHLIRREKPPKVMFSTIRFLKKTSKKLVLFQHLQQILLLLLRSLVIVLLVLAFARPLIDRSIARLLDVDPQSAVVLIDLSMSMQYEETFERAKTEALDIISSMTSGDEVALIGFSDGAQLVSDFNSDLDSVRSTINEISAAGFGRTRYLPNLRLADQMLEESRFENRAIYLISDFQAADIDAFDETWKLAPGVAFTGIDVGLEESTNLAITDVRSPERLLENASEQQILVRVRSTGTVYLQEGDVSLIVNGEVIDRKSVDLGDRSEEVVTFSTTFETEGSYYGEIRVGGDAFEADNSYYFTVDVLPKISVLTINGEASENWYDDEGHWFGLAVGGAERSPFELVNLTPGELSEAVLRQSDVLVLLNVGNLTDDQAEIIADYVIEGGALLVAPGDRVDPVSFNNQFESVAPALLEAQGLPNGNDYLVIADYDRRHPILRPIESDWSARFQGHWRLSPSQDSEVLMQFDNTEPALVERHVGDGSVILFASAMDLEWNNLPLQSLFLPFVHETLRHLVQPELKQKAYSVGDSFSVNLDEDAGSVSARAPNGDEIIFTNTDFITQVSEPGFVTVEAGGAETRFAINTLPEESNFARMPVENLFDSIINPDTNPIKSREVQNAQLAEELEQPQRLWWWILSLVMALVLVEALIANRTYR
ncbi:MAG: BatA domain-containing protein [Pseudohongiellaceae bacterium]